MMTPEMADRLERMALEVEVIEVQLNDNAHECPTCGLTVREDYSEHRNREVLAGLRQRLKRIAGSIRASK
jgi:hypothetical protein